MILDVVLLPPKNVSKKIGRAVRELGEQFKLKIAVDNKKLLPHISLLHVKANKKTLPQILNAVTALGKTVKPLKLRFTKPYRGSEYFAYAVYKSLQLYKIHTSVVKNISPLKTGFCEVAPGQGRPQDRRYIKAYGSANVFKGFRPHVTLGIVGNNSRSLDDIVQEVSKMRWTKEFLANRLALAEVNHKGQVFKVYKEYRLK